MQIAISDLTKKVRAFLLSSGMDDHDSEVMTQLIVEQEMIGNQFSPVGGLGGKHAQLENNAKAHEETVVQKAAVQLLKGNGRPAPLITHDHLQNVIDKAKQQGIYALGIYDSTYNEFFDVFCRRIAAQDCIAIIVENGGPQGVVPYGGKKDVTGTNPLAYGIPTHKYPIIFDAATAVHAYGRIRQARENNELLPENAYVDEDGNTTTDPHKAYAVLPFGGFKGYAINLLIDVLSGCLVRGKSGLEMPSGTERYIGTLIIVIDPSAFGDITEFKNSTTKLVEDLLAVPPVDPSQPVKVPGFRGSERIEKFTAQGTIEIDDHEWEKFSKAFNAQEKNSNP